MKHKIILSIALVLSVAILSLMKSDSTVNAQPPNRYTCDTGFVTLGAGQRLRITALMGNFAGNGDVGAADFVRFRRQQYMQTICSGGVCKSAVASQALSDPIALTAGEAASIDIIPTSNSSGVRGVVVSNSQDVRVNVTIIVSATGEVVSLLHRALCTNE